MSVMWIIIAVVLIIAAVIGAGKTVPEAAPRFKSRHFITANELEFLGRLEAAVPQYRFHCQVSMAAVLEPDVNEKSNRRDYWRVRNMFNQKMIDYVAQRRDDGKIVAIIELDDRSHNAEKDARRDAMLHQAGYKTIRWQSRAKPDTASIIAALVTPTAAAPLADTGTPAGNRSEQWGTARASASGPLRQSGAG